MKHKLILIATTFGIALSANATVRTVSNDPAGGAQYATLIDGYSNSTSGDTLLLEGTNIPYTIYGSSVWANNLTVIGIGHNPNKNSPRRTKISYASTDGSSTFFLYNMGNGSSFFGIEFTASIYLASNVSNYRFDDCKFNGAFQSNSNSATNLSYQNCIFNGIYNIDQTLPWNVTFTSCVFDSYINGNLNPNISCSIDHCLFLDGSYGGIVNLYNAFIQSCIIMNGSFTSSNIINSDFENNLCRINATFPIGSNGNSGFGNIFNTDPMFTNYTFGSGYSNSFDFHLQSGSPAIGTGNNGTDIGPHGSGSHFSETGEVLINPIIRSLYITNSSVAPNGNLNVHINATKPTEH